MGCGSHASPLVVDLTTIRDWRIAALRSRRVLPPLGGLDRNRRGSRFAVAATAGALDATQDLPRTPEFALLVAAGSIEGALLGAGQALGMRKLELPPRILRHWRW